MLQLLFLQLIPPFAILDEFQSIRDKYRLALDDLLGFAIGTIQKVYIFIFLRYIISTNLLIMLTFIKFTQGKIFFDIMNYLSLNILASHFFQQVISIVYSYFTIYSFTYISIFYRIKLKQSIDL